MELREPQGLDGTLSPAPEQEKRKKHKKKTKPDMSAINPTSTIAVYSNMLIAEQALRNQYMDLQWMRKKYATFFWIVCFLTIYLTWNTLCSPSIYPWFHHLQQLLTFTGYTVLGLFALTGLYTKVFSVAPRFLGDANKGLRPYNLRIVKQYPSLKERLFRLVDPAYMDHAGGLVKLIPSSHVFSAHFIETWEVYRQEYWERSEKRIKKRRNSDVKDATSPRSASPKKERKGDPKD